MSATYFPVVPVPGETVEPEPLVVELAGLLTTWPVAEPERISMVN
ncbi:hypothetical protein PJL18_02475 [Paenarthrobacter nicotinovorans]|nr:hypothetical protein [Paenarthrobacter nicotinovorans]